MSSRNLAAAGIHDPRLRSSYELCRQLHARHGKTYYLATRLLPADKRPYVHALYGLARYADEIVDDVGSALTDQRRADELRRWGDRFLADVRAGHSDDPVGRAVVDTVQRWRIPIEHFEAFLDSMAMDITVTQYDTYDDLQRYVYGSAAVIGLQMLPILEPLSADACTPAMNLGIAFQLTNFIRDVGEDLDRGRVYLPLADLERFGLTRRDLLTRQVDGRMRGLLAYQIARVRRITDSARPGIALLHPTSRPCIEAATTLYCGIVDEVENIDYQIFDHRARVPMRRRLGVAIPAWSHAVAARRTSQRSTPRRPQNTHQDKVWTTSENPNRRSSSGA